MNRGNALMRRRRLTIYVSIATPRLRIFLSVKNHFLTNPSNVQTDPPTAAIGARTAFDRATEKLGIEPSLTFAEKLEKAKSDGLVGTNERNALEVMISAGSAAAHRCPHLHAGVVETARDKDAMATCGRIAACQGRRGRFQ